MDLHLENLSNQLSYQILIESIQKSYLLDQISHQNASLIINSSLQDQASLLTSNFLSESLFSGVCLDSSSSNSPNITPRATITCRSLLLHVCQSPIKESAKIEQVKRQAQKVEEQMIPSTCQKIEKFEEYAPVPQCADTHRQDGIDLSANRAENTNGQIIKEPVDELPENIKNQAGRSPENKRRKVK